MTTTYRPPAATSESTTQSVSNSYYIAPSPAQSTVSLPTAPLEGWPIIIALGVGAAALISWYFVNFNYTYEDACDKVASYANYNYWKNEVPWYEYAIYSSWALLHSRYDRVFVQNVVSCYMNLVLENPHLPEYSAYSPDIQKILFAEMGKKLPYSIADMQYVMNATDYAASDGTVKIMAMKLPRTVRDNERLYKQPQVVQQEVERYNETRDKSFLEQVTDLLSTAFTIVLVVGGAIGAFWLYNNVPGLKK